MLREGSSAFAAFVFQALFAPKVCNTVLSFDNGKGVTTTTAFDFPGQPSIVTLTAIMKRGVLRQLVLNL